VTAGERAGRRRGDLGQLHKSGGARSPDRGALRSTVAALAGSATMICVDRSQLTLLGILRTAISSSIAEFAERGLDQGNTGLKETIIGLPKRCGLAVAASWIMCVASWGSIYLHRLDVLVWQPEAMRASSRGWSLMLAGEGRASRPG
jgi:hypothetical protein